MQARALSLQVPSPTRVAIATLVLAVASTLLQTAQARPYGPPPGGPEAAMTLGAGLPLLPRHRMHRLLEEVGASAEQQARIDRILDAAQTDLRAQREAGRTLREQARALFVAPALDAAAIESLRQQMLAQHDQASRRVTQALLDVGAVLTPGQRLAMGERMSRRREMAERHRAERRGLPPSR